MARQMKDSGVEWIDEIPEEWEVARLKQVFNFGKGLPITKEDLVDKGIPVISYGQIHAKSNTGVTVQQELIRYVPDVFRETNFDSFVSKNDFILADTSEDLLGCGNCVFVDREMELFAGYHTIILRSTTTQDNKYIAYLFLTDAWRSQIRSKVSGVKLFSISRKILSEATVLVPPKDVQRRIAAFLDRRCAEIDAVIERTKATIEEYKKLKQAVITEAVTKGVRGPRPMKDSGIEWIGEIPQGWELHKLKHIATILRGGSPRPIDAYLTDSPDGINWIKIGDTTKGYKYIDCTKQKITPYGATKSRTVHKGDLLLTNSMSFGEPYILNVDGCIHDGWVAFSDYHGVDIEYLYYFLSSSFCLLQFQKQVDGGVVQNLNIDKIASTLMLLPLVDEQREIVSYLDEKCAALDSLINKKTALLTELEAYKKSLIYEYVTGKKEVQ